MDGYYRVTIVAVTNGWALRERSGKTRINGVLVENERSDRRNLKIQYPEMAWQESPSDRENSEISDFLEGMTLSFWNSPYPNTPSVNWHTAPKPQSVTVKSIIATLVTND
jgi:hypothetical protein